MVRNQVIKYNICVYYATFIIQLTLLNLFCQTPLPSDPKK